MADLFDYLEWRGDLSLDASPFNEVDAMIVSRLAYAPFECVMAQRDMNGKTGKEICDALAEVPGLKSMLVYKDDMRLIDAVRVSPRLGALRYFMYVNDTDAETQSQFAVITAELRRGLYYVCYRGTDASIVGWKEDLNMGFICPVPSQGLALKYLNELSAVLSGKFILGGHSKGGNLAVYAAAYCDDALRDRICAVYNFDGPGFDERVLKSEGFGDIWSKVYTYVPQSSIVGMLLAHDEKYTVVKSSRAGGLLQHDTYSWQIERDKFVYLKSVNAGSRVMDYALREWISGMSRGQREQFAETLYTVLSETNAETFKELGENWLASAEAVLKSVKNLDESARKAASETVRALVKSTRNGIVHAIRKDR